MNVIDSSGWLEYFADAIADTEELIVPIISLLEVFKRILQQRDENAALQAVACMRQGRVVPLDEETALNTAKLGELHRLPLADSVILATARRHEATLWTQDSDFEGLEHVRYIAKHPAP